LRIAAIAIVLGALATSGCGETCNAKLAECSTECHRRYQLCQLHGNDIFYCHNQAGQCAENCDYDRKTCKEPIYHFW